MAGRDFRLHGDVEYSAELALAADARCARLTARQLREPERADADAPGAGEPTAARIRLGRPSARICEGCDRCDGDASGPELDLRARRSPGGDAALALLVPLRADRDRRSDLRGSSDGAQDRRAKPRDQIDRREVRTRYRWAV